ncbi:alpha/beta hydrolase [Arcanobacterium canis]
MNLSPRSFFLLVLFVTLGVLAFVIATRFLRRGRIGRAVVAAVLAAVVGLGAMGIQMNRVSQFAKTWPAVAHLAFGKSEGEGVKAVAQIPPREKAVWEGKGDARYQVTLTEFHPEGKGVPGHYYQTTFTGPQSKIRNDVIIWAPEGWQGSKDLGVVEFLHGYPGKIAAIPQALGLARQMDAAIRSGKLRPSVFVIPLLWVDTLQPDGVDLPGRPKVGTWAARDIPGMIAANFPVSHDAKRWTLSGISAGGYTAPVLAVMARDTFENAISLSGSDAPEMGGLLRTSAKVQSKFTISHMLKWAPTLNLYAVAGDASLDAGARKLIHNLDSVRGHAGVVTTEYVPGGKHSWAQWKHYLGSSLTWLGKVQAGKIRTDVRHVPRLMTSASAPAGMGKVYTGLGIIIALACAAFVARAWLWRGTRENSAVSSRLIRLLVWDIGAVALVILAMMAIAVALVNVRAGVVRSHDDLISLLIMLGLPQS